MIAPPLKTRKKLGINPVGQIFPLSEITRHTTRHRHKCHQRPVANQQAPAQTPARTAPEIKIGQPSPQSGQRNPLQNAHPPDLVNAFADPSITPQPQHIQNQRPHHQLLQRGRPPMRRQ